MALQTTFSFTLPKGYVDASGTLHRHGTMRLATARDEIEPLRDQRVAGPDDPYLTVLVIARVVTELGSLPRITPSEIEGLFAADLAFLQDLYGIINFGDPADVEALQRSVLPEEPEVPVVESVGTEGDDDAGEGDDDGAPSEVAAPLTRRGRIEEVGSRTGP
jgi:hypothetical protein